VRMRVRRGRGRSAAADAAVALRPMPLVGVALASLLIALRRRRRVSSSEYRWGWGRMDSPTPAKRLALLLVNVTPRPPSPSTDARRCGVRRRPSAVAGRVVGTLRAVVGATKVGQRRRHCTNCGDGAAEVAVVRVGWARRDAPRSRAAPLICYPLVVVGGEVLIASGPQWLVVVFLFLCGPLLSLSVSLQACGLLPPEPRRVLLALFAGGRRPIGSK